MEPKYGIALKRPYCPLVGEDGNVFSIIGRARSAARKAGWTPTEIEAFTNECQASKAYCEVLEIVQRETTQYMPEDDDYGENEDSI